MTFSPTSRWFFTAALAHLSVVGGLLLFEGRSEGLTVQWNVTVWLLLVGFVGCTAFGFAFHLFPAVARRASPRGPWAPATFVLTEASVVGGAISLAAAPTAPYPGVPFSASATLLLCAFGISFGAFVTSLARPRLVVPGPERRPGDLVTVPLFLAAWASGLVASALFVLSGFSVGPEFGWWLAGVHLFALGYAALLIAAVTLRIVPRLVDADGPAAAAAAIAALGIAGAIFVPIGMLTVPPDAAGRLDGFAIPEAGFAVLLFLELVYLAWTARSPRSQIGLHLSAVIALLGGGGLGLWMVAGSSYDPVVAHALANLLGFVGLTILLMWFGMIAPFQRISHAWTRRMLWTLSIAWLGSVLLLVGFGATPQTASAGIAALGGALLLGVAIAWAGGTLPVLFPRINPLPGMTAERIRVARDRWSRR